MCYLKIGKGTEYIIGQKSKGLYNSKLIKLHSAFLPKVKYLGIKQEYNLITLLQLWSKSIIQEKL